MKKKVRVRFAPSPTGPLHMGGVRTALYNYLFARQQGGDFLLRIEDTDQNRYVPGAEAYIIEALRWCGIEPREGQGFGDGRFGPYRQSERKEHYRLYAEQLVRQGSAYYAFDTPEELEALRERLKAEKSAVQQYGPSTRGGMQNGLSLPDEEVRRRLENGDPYVIRVKMPAGEELVFHDLIRGEVRVNTATLDDKVLFKSDGMPTYHLANVVDDHLMEISHVIRGEEWLPSTPLHVLLYRVLGWDQPQFAHLPLLLKPDGKGKLSKRDGDRLGFPVFPLEWNDPAGGGTSSGYRERGFFPEAFVNMLALLGWTPPGGQEIMNLDEMASVFELEKVHKAGSKYNYEKACWFNQQYLHQKSDPELAALFLPLLAEKAPDAGRARPDEADNAEGYITRVVSLIRDRCTLIPDLWEQGSFFFLQPADYDVEPAKKKWDASKEAFFEKVIRLFESDRELWAGAGKPGNDSAGKPGNDSAGQSGNDGTAGPESVPGERLLEEKFKSLMQTADMKPGEVLLPLRIMLTGGRFGPGVFAIAALLGREETVRRIRLAQPAFAKLTER